MMRTKAKEVSGHARPKRLRRRHCWAVTLEYFYVKQTCNPDYKPGEQPVVHTRETILMTETSEDPFTLQPKVADLITAATHSDSMGSRRVRVLKICYAGVNEEYE